MRFGYESFWLQEKVRQQYPDIWEEISLLFIAFPSSYVVEKAFSSVINVLNKRSNLDISKGGDLRLYLTELKPNIEKLASSHQAHPSHWMVGADQTYCKFFLIQELVNVFIRNRCF